LGLLPSRWWSLTSFPLTTKPPLPVRYGVMVDEETPPPSTLARKTFGVKLMSSQTIPPPRTYKVSIRVCRLLKNFLLHEVLRDPVSSGSDPRFLSLPPWSLTGTPNEHPVFATAPTDFVHDRSSSASMDFPPHMHWHSTLGQRPHSFFALGPHLFSTARNLPFVGLDPFKLTDLAPHPQFMIHVPLWT